MIVNSSLFVFPEVVHKAIKLLLVYLKVETQKYICKVPSVDNAASVFVNQLKQAAKFFNFGSRNSVDHLSDN